MWESNLSNLLRHRHPKTHRAPEVAEAGGMSHMRGRGKGRNEMNKESRSMKKLSDANHGDFEFLLDSAKGLSGLETAEGLAQAFVNVIYDYFQESLVLLRLFLSVPYSTLPSNDQQLVENKVKASGSVHLLNDRTPALTLMGTRGKKPEWNDRSRSQGFRCIPLVSSEYVSSLSMLSMQFRKMNMDFRLFDSWETSVVARGRADEYKGTLYIEHAATDKDEQGRMIVPRQDFVAENNVKTVLGFGSGYPNSPTIATLFVFTKDVLDGTKVEPFASLLQTYVEISKELVGRGSIFQSV